jgi:hypothetical protein
MSHQHFCHVAGHYWECEGTALRGGDAEPTVCVCSPCGLPLEGFDHSGCNDPVELLACPEHMEEFRQRSGVSAAPAEAEQGESLAETAPEEEARPFERFPLVPIGPDDPLWHCAESCHCGCRRMPPELFGGFCVHCGHLYQLDDPEFWRGEEFPHSQAAHVKGCAAFQEYAKKGHEGWAKFRAMTANAGKETFSKLWSACYSQAIDDNYEAYMSAPEGSPERAAIVEGIAAANAEEIAERKRQWDARLEKQRSE